MPTFVHQPLLWGLLIVGVPVLIHLINLMRHRKVQWAAMEFLLKSQKRSRTWILFKQLLLLLLRMAAIAAIVLMLAQPTLRNKIGQIFGGSQTHHIVLLDDSFSTSDRWSNGRALDEAKQVVTRIGKEAARQVQPQTFTILRYSQAGGLGQGTQLDMQQERVDTQFVGRLREILDPLEPSDTAVSADKALAAVEQFLIDSDAEDRIIYLITDFRAHQWKKCDALRNQLHQIEQTGAKLHLIQCVDQARPNLAITDLTPAKGTRAVGVPLMMEVAVKNFSTAPIKNVAIAIEADETDRPSVAIEEIPAGKAVRKLFSMHFSTGGEHRITAQLETDPIKTDNFRHVVVDLPTEHSVLIIDGGLDATDARYMAAALKPGGSVTTGLNPQIEKSRYLSLHPLDQFHSIYLMNVNRLDLSAIEALERYVASGGGLGFFLGPQSRAKFLNESLYRDGKGLFPLPVAGESELLIDRLQKTPDLQVTGHPIFRILAGARNNFISTVNIRHYFEPSGDWDPAADAKVEVIAQLRNGDPLAVERRFGEGRVIAFLTTAAPKWNNWARGNPSFVVAMLELQAYLARTPSNDISHLVGSPLLFSLDPTQYESRLRFLAPGEDLADVATMSALSMADGSLTASLSDTPYRGIYQTHLRRTDGSKEIHHDAYNVDTEESDLAIVSGPQLAAALDGVRYRYEQAALFQYAEQEQAGFNLGQAILLLLVGILIVEQLLAWSTSYHPSSKRPLRAKGVAA